MVREEIVRVRRLLTLHLVLLAFLTATLVAAGSHSVFLPLLVLVVGVSSLLFVDWFEWFSLHHVLAYFGMILGTIAALVDYFFSAGSDPSAQLHSIARLLIYPEIVIMLQRKNMRLFEQLAVFLLLEIIVAALVNDNVLFGALLIPIVLLWVSALLLLTRYSSLIQLAPDLDKPTPRAIELIRDAWQKARQRKHARPAKMLDVVQPSPTHTKPIRRLALLGQSGPIGIVSLVFAGLYFYLLPRAAVDVENYSMAPRTGLSDTLTLGSMGKLLQDSTHVMRLSLRDAKTDEPYRLDQPPYIRGTVVSRYFRTASTSSFESSDQAVGPPSDPFEPLNSFQFSPANSGRDQVVAKFEILTSDGSMLPCIAPMVNYDRDHNFMSVLPFEWKMINNRSDHFPNRNKPNYSLLTTAFQQGHELPVLPDSRQILNRPNAKIHDRLMTTLSRAKLEQGFYSTRWIEELLARVQQIYPNAHTPIELARAVEAYLSVSGEFTYSLDARTASETDMDPIEDFVVNQKRGHCQYFAAALTMALRYEGIPTRIVMGYHPLEYNELGDYFSVRRRDAHAWVEAYFDAEQLKAANLYTADLGQTGGWLRLDPTPAGLGSNAGTELRPQADQGLDLVNRFWNEYVLNGRQRAEENSLYEPLQESTRVTYEKMVELARESIRWGVQSQLVGGAITRENWFAWPTAVLLMLVGSLLVLIWRLIRWLPRWAPQLARKLGIRPSSDDIGQQFFKQCLKLLRRAGFVRHASQTAAEYTGAAGEKLEEGQRWSSARAKLGLITAAYYQMRFGGNQSLSASTQQRILAALDEMEHKVK